MAIPSVNYHLDLFVGLQRQDGLDTDPRWRCDYVVTPDGDPASAEIFKAKGINHHYIKAGVFKPEAVDGKPRLDLVQDVIFVGGGAEYGHFREWPYRRELVAWLERTYGNRYSKYGHPQATMRNQDLNDLYSSVKVVVADSLCPGFTKPNFWSDRVYETIGRGGFIIHPYIKGMEEEFTDGETIVFYEYGNLAQLKEKIDYYLDPAHADERERIRTAGQAWVRENATYHNRLQQLLDVVFPSEGSDNDLTELTSVFKSGDVEGMGRIQRRIDLDRIAGNSLRINLGAGQDQFEGFVNVDFLDLPGIDVVHNLMTFPYPFEDESAVEIRSVDFVEHLDHFTDDKRPAVIAFVEECHRILKPGGTLVSQTPSYNAEFAWQDPTHIRPFHPKTFILFDPDSEYGKTNGYYSKAKFHVRVEELENHNLQIWMTKR
jgi:SAM-dependent methyltransferase